MHSRSVASCLLTNNAQVHLQPDFVAPVVGYLTSSGVSMTSISQPYIYIPAFASKITRRSLGAYLKLLEGGWRRHAGSRPVAMASL